jgi:hypothetical protein
LIDSRQRDAGCALVEQFTAKQRLQSPDLRAYRRLRDPEGMRRTREAAQIDHRDERSQQIGRNIGDLRLHASLVGRTATPTCLT